MEEGYKYSGRYFNSKSTRAIPVEVTIGIGNLSIFSPTENLSMSWPVANILEIKKNSNRIILKYGSESDIEIIEIANSGFEKDLRGKNPQVIKSSQASNTIVYALFLGIFFILLFALAFYFFILPYIVDSFVKSIPKKTEENVGKQMVSAFINGEKINTKASIIINKFYSHLNSNTEYTVHITVVDSKIKNAFALPGGEMVVYSSILKSMKSYTELAALLGHETGHIAKRHSLKLLVNNVSINALFGAIFQDYPSLSGMMVLKARDLAQLSYNRKAEEEADDFGYEVLKLNKIDPAGMIRLFEHLKEGDNISSELPEFVMTHPKLESRILRTIERIKNDPFVLINSDSLGFYWNNLNHSL